jgi:hypothetical protein
VFGLLVVVLGHPLKTSHMTTTFTPQSIIASRVTKTFLYETVSVFNFSVLIIILIDGWLMSRSVMVGGGRVCWEGVVSQVIVFGSVRM